MPGVICHALLRAINFYIGLNGTLTILKLASVSQGMDAENVRFWCGAFSFNFISVFEMNINYFCNLTITKFSFCFTIFLELIDS